MEVLCLPICLFGQASTPPPPCKKTNKEKTADEERLKFSNPKGELLGDLLLGLFLFMSRGWKWSFAEQRWWMVQENEKEREGILGGGGG